MGRTAPVMGPAVIVPPEREPVTASEVATHSRLRIETAAELQHVELLIRAARRSVELYLRRSLMTQTLRLSLDEWPAEEMLYLPHGPVQSVASVVYRPAEGVGVTWSSGAYEALVWPLEPAALLVGDAWPAETLRARAGIEVTYVAGYGANAADVPEMFRLATLLVVGDYIENREATVFQSVPAQSLAMSSGVQALLGMDRDWFHYGRT